MPCTRCRAPHAPSAYVGARSSARDAARTALWALAVSLCGLWLCACTPTDGALLVRAGTAGQGAPEAALPMASASGIRPGMRLQYQLVGPIDVEADAELFVIDLFDARDDTIDRLRQDGRVIVAYVSAGTYEPWRPDTEALPMSVLGARLVGYPDERWLDVRDPAVRTLMSGRMDLARERGSAGVLLTSLEGYRVDSGHPLSQADQLEYNLWLAQQAQQRQLSAGISGDWAQAEALAEAYGFAIHVDCIASGRCQELQPYVDRGRAVFDLETDGNLDILCPEAERLSLPITLKRPNFDSFMAVCP